jgi:hypothetical protein
MTGFVVNGHERAVAGLQEQYQRKLTTLQAQLKACPSSLERETIGSAIRRTRGEHQAALAKLSRCLF